MNPSVLIVDDDPQKVAAITAALRLQGIPDDSIAAAAHAAEARQVLSKRFFNVMLLDVLLPARAGAVPAGDVSVDLLRQIVEDGTTPAPAHILAITADLSALRVHDSAFRRMTTQVLHVEVGASEWRESLALLVKRVVAEEQAKATFDIDICVQTALRSPEQIAVLQYWPASWTAEEHLSRGVLVRKGKLLVQGRTLSVACAHASQMGIVASTHLAGVLLNRFRPRILAMTGICGGIGSEIQLGDVVVADKSWDWQSGKWNEAGKLLSAVDQKDASADLVALARGVDAQLEKLYHSYDEEKPDQVPRLHVAPIVSGSSVVEHESLHQLLIGQHRKVGAVDMECYGVYYQASAASQPAPKVLCVKAVTDFAKKGKENTMQRFGSYISAMTMLATLKRWAVLPI